MTGKHRKRNRTEAKVTALGLAALVGLTGIASASFVPMVGETEASWTVSEHFVSDSLTAGAVESPLNVRCESGILGLNPTIYWDPPADGPPPEGYIFEVRESGVLGPDGVISSYTIDDPETTSRGLNRNLLELLGDLLQIGQEYSVTLRTEGPGEWTSDPSNAADFSLLLGLISSCS